MDFSFGVERVKLTVYGEGPIIVRLETNTSVSPLLCATFVFSVSLW